MPITFHKEDGAAVAVPDADNKVTFFVDESGNPAVKHADGTSSKVLIDGDAFTTSEKPVLTYVANGFEGTDITVLIANYDDYMSGVEFGVKPQGGTAVLSEGKIIWTLPQMDVAGPVTLDVTAREFGKATSTSTATVTVALIPFNVDGLGITSPAEGAVDVKETAAVAADTPVSSDPAYNHISTSWYVSPDGTKENAVVKSVDDAVNLNSWVIPKGMLENTAYKLWREVKMSNGELVFTLVSNKVSFTTIDSFNTWPDRADASLDGLAAPLSAGTAYYGGVKALNSDQQVTVYEDDPNNRLAIDVTSVSGSSVSKLGGVFIETGAFTALAFAVISELEIAVFYVRSSDSHNMLAFFTRESTSSYTFEQSQIIDFGLTAAGNYVGTGATMTETELAFVHGREFYMVTKSGGNWGQGSALATLPSESFGYGAALAKLSDTAIACAFQKTIGSPRGTGMLVISRPEKASTAWVAGSAVEISPNSFSSFHNGIAALSDTEFCIGTMNSTGQHRGIFASIPTATSNVPTVDQDVLILGDGAGAYISPVLVMENTVLWFFASSTAGYSTVVSKDETWGKGADVLINNSSSPYITGCRVDDNTVLSTYTNSGDGSRQTAKVVIGG